MQGASSIFGLLDIGIGLFFIVVQGPSHCVGLGIFRPLRSVKVSYAPCGRSFSAWPWYSLGREDGNWQYEAIKQAVAGGLGLSILSLHALGPDAAPRSLVALNVEALEYTLELEQKTAECKLQADNTFFVLMLCGEGFYWNDDELEDFVAFYFTGAHGSDDPFSKAEAQHMGENSLKLAKNISRFA